jgi:cytochrome b561
MRLTNTQSSYGGVAKLLHWLIVGLIIVQWFLAEWAHEAGHGRAVNPAAAIEQLALLARHKSVGLTIFALALIRLIWRWVSPPPALPPAMPRWQVLASRLIHYAFYVVLFAMPISGLVMSAAANYPVAYFGLFKLPNLVAPDEALEERMEELHEAMFYVLVVLAGLHVVAALKHHFVDHDDVLRRMMPWWPR